MTASERAQQVWGAIKANREEPEEEQEPEVTYPKLEELRISHCVIVDKCPGCGEVHGMDLGSMTSEEVPERISFECESCPEKWFIAFDLTELLRGGKPWRWEQDADDHWRCDLPGDHVMSVWSTSDGEFVWEVWPEDRPNPDEPDFTDNAVGFEEACDAAEQCAREQGLIT
jgi:hypothetical protein